jgi:biotin/methionine sulfoxide reductase
VIPVARLSDMLLHPGEAYEFDGQHLRYPDIRLVYWAGGNAFHHHQDINRLCEAWRRPETVVVHEQFWTAQAKFSDIVLPVTTSLEREDIGSGGHDGFMIAMSAQIPPVGEARDDYAIFCDLAERLGCGERFSEGATPGSGCGRSTKRRGRARGRGIALPSFDEFWQQGCWNTARRRNRRFSWRIFAPTRSAIRSHAFRQDRAFSETIAGFGYRECPGHPWWDEQEAAWQRQEAARWPLHLLSSQPRTRLHSQYDHGSVSRATKIQGREPLWMHPQDAQARDISEGSVVKVYNARGAILAGVHLSEQILPGVVQMSTGAWYDPLDPNEKGRWISTAIPTC